MSITRISFVNPTAAEHFINVSGNAYQIEDMTGGNDTAPNRTTIHAGDFSDGGGVPVINRTRVLIPGGFDRLVVHQNSGATAANTVYILIWNTEEIDLQLPSV